LDCSAWAALVFPKGTPDAIVGRLNQATNEMLETPALRQRMEELGMSIPAPTRRTPGYLARFVPAEIEKWAAPIKAAGLTGE
jgi:tripartite-type tricarboxylate transporter receptor subunit TctC